MAITIMLTFIYLYQLFIKNLFGILTLHRMNCLYRLIERIKPDIKKTFLTSNLKVQTIEVNLRSLAFFKYNLWSRLMRGRAQFV